MPCTELARYRLNTYSVVFFRITMYPRYIIRRLRYIMKIDGHADRIGLQIQSQDEHSVW